MASASYLHGRDRGRFRGDEVLLDLLECRDELPLRARRYTACRIAQRVRSACVHLLEDRLRLRRQE
jgi:hypothetical protein